MCSFHFYTCEKEWLVNSCVGSDDGRCDTLRQNFDLGEPLLFRSFVNGSCELTKVSSSRNGGETRSSWNTMGHQIHQKEYSVSNERPSDTHTSL